MKDQCEKLWVKLEITLWLDNKYNSKLYGLRTELLKKNKNFAKKLSKLMENKKLKKDINTKFDYNKRVVFLTDTIIELQLNYNSINFIELKRIIKFL